MKTLIALRILLLFFVNGLFLACTQNVGYSDPSEDLLNNLSERFMFNDYIKVEEMGFTNPYQGAGMEVENLFQNMLRHPLIKEIKKSPYDANIPTLGIKDPNKLVLAKGIIKQVLSKGGYSISEKEIDEMNDGMNRYLLNSEGVITMLNAAERNHSITPLQHEIITIELQEMMAAKTATQIQNICSTVEYEINIAKIADKEKERLLLLNAIIRNLYDGPIPFMGSLPSLILSEDPIFLQTGEVVVTGVILIVFVVDGLVNAFQNPSCTAPCQIAATSAAITLGYIGVEYITGQACETCP